MSVQEMNKYPIGYEVWLKEILDIDLDYVVGNSMVHTSRCEIISHHNSNNESYITVKSVFGGMVDITDSSLLELTEESKVLLNRDDNIDNLL